jgi:lipoprotein-releasing system ATP-binding protein
MMSEAESNATATASPVAARAKLSCYSGEDDAPQTHAIHLAAHGLHKTYYKGLAEVPVLRGVELEVRQGEFLSIIGQSGSGKSTLLHLLATLDAPDEGEIFFQNNRIDNLASAGRDLLRNKYFGMIFQFYHLLPELTTLENVLAPLMIAESFLKYRRHRKQHVQNATDLLETVGLGHRLKHKPRELSGGEMQRAAIARALIANPILLLADEPTGNLDRETGEEIMHLLKSLNRDQNLTIIMVTHDGAIADQADRIIRLAEGKVVEAE